MNNLEKYTLIALFILAALGKAVADAQAHGSPTLARWFPRWAGPDSWKLKYRNGEAAQGPRFWLSTTLLVFLTDCWHCMNFITGASIDAAFLLAGWPQYQWWTVAAIALRRAVFEPIYRWLRTQL